MAPASTARSSQCSATRGRDTDAERWGRRGLAEAPVSYWADGLRAQLTGLLLASGRGEEAVAVHRAESGRRALRQDYSRLRDTAERVGQWSGLRDWALEYLRDFRPAQLLHDGKRRSEPPLTRPTPGPRDWLGRCFLCNNMW